MMPPPNKLIGLSQRRRRVPPKPNPPPGYMYDHNTLKPIAELEAYHQRNMNWYDSQPYVVRALIQERGLGAVKSARAALRVTQSHVPSTPDSDSVTYTGVDFGNDDRSEFVIVDEWGTIKRW